MEREEKRNKLKLQREKLIQSLEETYQHAFDELSKMDLEEGSIAKLSQIFLLSREAAISHLIKEVEKPVITRAANNQIE